jgi:hypothetical protein
MAQIAESMWAVDMDRTLLDTELTFDKFARLCVCNHVVNGDVLDEAKRATEGSVGSFDVMNYLKDYGVEADTIDGLYQEFAANKEGDELLYDDAVPFITRLDEAGIPNLILTKGSETWQTAKLLAAGMYSRPHFITPVAAKGELITTWRTREGYQVASSAGKLLVARSVILVDDKLESFEGLPDDCAGFLIDRSKVVTDMHLLNLPRAVAVKHSLYGLAA